MRRSPSLEGVDLNLQAAEHAFGWVRSPSLEGVDLNGIAVEFDPMQPGHPRLRVWI